MSTYKTNRYSQTETYIMMTYSTLVSNISEMLWMPNEIEDALDGGSQR